MFLIYYEYPLYARDMPSLKELQRQCNQTVTIHLHNMYVWNHYKDCDFPEMGFSGLHDGLALSKKQHRNHQCDSAMGYEVLKSAIG